MGFKVSKQKKVEDKGEDPLPADSSAPSSAQNRSQSHLIVLADTLNMLRKKGSLCDVTIEAKDPQTNTTHKYSVHKCVLVASSGYFRELFKVSSLDFDEEIKVVQQPVARASLSNHGSAVSLPIPVDPDLMESVLSYMYKGSLDVKLPISEEMMKLCEYLQIPSLIQDCIKNFQTSEFKKDAFDELYLSSKQVGSGELKQFALDKAAENFMPLLEDKKFDALSAGEMQEIISHRAKSAVRKRQSESEYFDMVVEWIKQDPEKRKDFGSTLLKGIRYDKIPQQKLSGYILQHSMVARDEELCKTIRDVMSSNKKKVLGGLRRRGAVRAFKQEELTLLVVGGTHYDQFASQVHRMDKQSWSWKEFSRTPIPIAHHCVAVVNNTLYVAGGEIPAVGGERCVPSLWSFNLLKKSWDSLDEMRQSRAHFYLGVHGNSLYAIGGCDGNKVRNSVEKFCVETMKWEYTQFLQHSTFDHAGCQYQGRIYISGGVVKHSSTDNLLQFEPQTHHWKELSPMKHARNSHCMAAASDQIYIFGGENEEMDLHHKISAAIECYDPDTDQWHKVAPNIDIQRVIDFACAEIEGSIYLVGGCRNNLTDYRQHVASYNPVEEKWASLPKLPQKLRGCACAVMHL